MAIPLTQARSDRAERVVLELRSIEDPHDLKEIPFEMIVSTVFCFSDGAMERPLIHKCLS